MMRIGAIACLLLLGCGGSRAVEGDAASVPDGALPSCGDPTVMQRFSACMAADTRATCAQAGGDWRRIGLSPDESCSCPTGQDGCSCTRSTDCLGACRAPMPVMWECSAIKEGSCSSRWPSVGCWCWFDGDGKVEGICAD
jgi:hypothetical protein